MPRTYRRVKGLEEEIFRLKEEGKTNREIRELYGLSEKQMKNLITRHNRREEKKAMGILPRRPGRPPKGAYAADKEKDYEIFAIYRHKDKHSVKEMCEFFEVSRIKRMDIPDKDEELAQEIAECQQRCKKTYGYRRVHIWLAKVKNRHCNPKTVLRIMRKHGLLSEIRRRKKYKRMGQNLHVYDNHLNRNFYADKPNQKWVTDISYTHTAQGVLYLSAIRDLFDNSIVAYNTGTEQAVNLVLNTIKAAKEKEAVTTELQLHSDQGFQYTSRAYHNLTKEYGITPSMSRRGNCLDNAMAENFFSILKSECINRQKIKDFAMAKSLIDDYVHFYNYERIQLKTKLTPYEKRCQLA